MARIARINRNLQLRKTAKRYRCYPWNPWFQKWEKSVDALLAFQL